MTPFFFPAGRIKRPRDEDVGEEDDVDLPKRRRGEGPRIELRILMQSKVNSLYVCPLPTDNFTFVSVERNQ